MKLTYKLTIGLIILGFGYSFLRLVNNGDGPLNFLATRLGINEVTETAAEGVVNLRLIEDLVSGNLDKEYTVNYTENGVEKSYTLQETVGELPLPGSKVKVIESSRVGILSTDEAPQISVQTLSEIQQASAVIGTRKVAVVLLNWSDLSDAGMTKDSITTLFNGLGGIREYFKEISYNKLDIGIANTTTDVFGPYTMSKSSTEGGTSLCYKIQTAFDDNWMTADPVKEWVRANVGINESNYQHVIYMLAGNAGCVGGATRVGYPGGEPYAITINSKAYLKQTISHEIMHNFGAYHASRLHCGTAQIGTNCTFYSYQDKYDVMGNGFDGTTYRAYQPGAYFKEFFGWQDPATILNVAQNGTYTIAPLEKATTTGKQIVKVYRNSTSFYVLENRIKYLSDSNLPDTAYNGILIKLYEPNTFHGDPYYSDTLHLTGQTSTSQAWPIGVPFEDSAFQIKITPLARTGDNVSVKVEYLGGAPMLPPSPSPVPSVAPSLVPSPVSSPTPSPLVSPIPSVPPSPPPVGLSAPTLQAPGTPNVSNAVTADTTPDFTWLAGEGTAKSYELLLDTDESFATPNTLYKKGIAGTAVKYTSASTLAKGKYYYWKMRKYSGTSYSDWSPIGKFHIPLYLAKPVLKTPATGAIVTPGTAILSWTGTTNGQFEVQVCEGSSNFTTCPKLSKQSTSNLSVTIPVTTATTYYWRVGNYSPTGDLGWSAAYSLKGKIENPSSSSMKVDETNTLRPSFSWAKVNGATSYALSVFSNGTCTGTAVLSATVAASDTPRYVPTADITAIRNKSQVCWRVKAVSTLYGSSSLILGPIFAGANPPSVPVLVSPLSAATGVAYTSLTLKWKLSPATATIPAGVYYRVQLATDSKFTNIKADSVVNGGISYTVTGLSSKTKYYWRVRALTLEIGGQESSWSTRYFTTR